MFNTQGNGTFKYNLEQGKAILNYNEEVDDIVKPHLKIIQEGSLIEGLNGSSGLSLKDKKTVEGLQSIENEFNKTIAQYNQVYKQFSEDLMNRKNQLNEVSPYLGKNIKNSSGGIYYVNNFGNYYWYSADAWNDGNPEGCPAGYEQLPGEVPTQLTRGANMNVGTPCGAAGQVVKNTDSGDMAWVDIQGYKHSFPEGTKMSSSCAQMNILELSNDAYNAIPSGNSMSSVEPCMSLDVNPTIWKQLNQLNIKLKFQAAAITKEINSLSTQDQSINNQLSQTRSKMNTYIDQIDKDNLMLAKNKRMLVTAGGEQEDSNLRMTSNYYFLLIWILLMFLIISLSMAAYASDSKKIAGLSYVIVAVFTLLFIVYLYNKIVVTSNSITIV
jgi:hypothetical protein